MEKMNAIVVKATDYKEADKLVRLCTVESGVITATLKGCRKATAKLAFAGRPFLFGEFILSEKSGRYTITGCSPIESYSNIVSVSDYYAGYCILEMLDSFVSNGASGAGHVVTALKALAHLGTERNDSVLLAYTLNALREEGYGLDFARCILCGEPPKKYFFSYGDGGTVCEACATESSRPIDAQTANYLRVLATTPIERATSVKIPKKNAKEGLLLLCSFFEGTWGVRLKCYREYIKLPF